MKVGMKREKGSSVRKNTKKEWKIGQFFKCNKTKQEKYKNEYKYNLDKERGWRVKNRKSAGLGAWQEPAETKKKVESWRTV